jgi:hypothetical protein
MAAVPPQTLVTALLDLFTVLQNGTTSDTALGKCANARFAPDLADFLVYVAAYHQPEHWLESQLVGSPSLLAPSYCEARSQVVVGYRDDSRWRFIDLLCLDRQNRLLVVTELKVVKASGAAVRQAQEYLEFVKMNKDRILDPAYGYFEVAEARDYRVAAAFVAPAFTSNFGDYVSAHIPTYDVRCFRLNEDWRCGAKTSLWQP